MSITNAFLKATENLAYVTCNGVETRQARPCIVCKDGFTISIQANQNCYCTPRKDHQAFYSKVELGYPNQHDELLDDYAEEPWNPTGTVYAYVPVEVVDELLKKHGVNEYLTLPGAGLESDQ